MSKREEEVVNWLDSLRADAERGRGTANQPPETAQPSGGTPRPRRRRRRGVRQWLQETFTPEPAPDLPAGTDVAASSVVRQGNALRNAGVAAPPANLPRRYFDPYAALQGAAETARPVAQDATSTPQSRRAPRIPGRPDPERTGTIGPDTRNRTQRALDEERTRERRRLRERPAAVRALDYAAGAGAQTLTLGYRDELMGALSPVSTAEDFEDREALRREAATGGDRVAGIAGAILGASVPIGAQNALLARSARLAPEGTVARSALESFGATGARTRLGDVARGVAEGLPYDLAYDYEEGESRGTNLAIGALAGGLAGGLLRPGGNNPRVTRERRAPGSGEARGFLSPELNEGRLPEGAQEAVPAWLRELEGDATRRRVPAQEEATPVRGAAAPPEVRAPDAVPFPARTPDAEIAASARQAPEAPATPAGIDQSAEDAYQRQRRAINEQVRAGTLDREDADRRLKEMGMRRAAERRRETGQLTDRERAAAAAREASNYTGKRVVVQTEGGPVNGEVVGNTFGRVRVRTEDGSVVSAFPDRVSPAESGTSLRNVLADRVGAVGDAGAVERLRQTSSPEFRRWFGDSKVSDEQGQPLTMYRGSPNPNAGSYGGDGLIFTTPYRDFANHYARGGQLYEIYVRSKQPFDASRGEGLKLWREFLRETDSPSWATQGTDRGALPAWTIERELRQWLDAKGIEYDGIWFGESNGTASLAVRDATQIKSATGNSGAFDPDNPDIAGAATPDLLNLVARTGAGAVVGGAAGGTLDPENPVRGAALGALAGAGLGAASMRGAINADADFAARRRAGLELADELRNRPRTDAGFVRTNADEMATLTPATTERSRTGFPLALGPDRQVDPLRLPDMENVAAAGRTAMRPLQNQYGAVGDLSRLNEQTAAATLPAKVTETPQFRRWFGDSKVVDESGEPLVVYKGMWPPDNRAEPMTSINRREFAGFPAYNGDEPDVDIAGFFTSSKDVANVFARGINERGGHGPSVYPVHLSMQNPYVIDAKGNYAGEYQFGPEGKPFRDAIRGGEYDGVIIRNTGDEGDVYIPLHPEQIKSAIGNSGAFDPRNPDITGAADPRLVGDIARTGAGALAGAAIDREDPLRGAAIGAGAGAASRVAGRSMARAAGNRFGAVGDISALRTSAGVPRFYSRLENAVRSGQSAAPATQWLRYLDGHPGGIAKGEREWTGVDEWLRAQGNRKVTRAELEQHLAQNRVQVGEVAYGATPERRAELERVRGEAGRLATRRDEVRSELERALAQLSPIFRSALVSGRAMEDIAQWGRDAVSSNAYLRAEADAAIGGAGELMDAYRAISDEANRAARALYDAEMGTRTRYGQFQVPGGEPGTYREVLLTLPDSNASSDAESLAKLGLTEAEYAAMPAAQRQGILSRMEVGQEGTYRSPHWDEPNVLAHIRMDDRTLPNGERVLFIQEAQSDWHQTGRENGYHSGRTLSSEERKELNDLRFIPFGERTPAQIRRTQELTNIDSEQGFAVPDAPFKNTDEWMGLALKRAIDEATDGGYDRVAWSTGDQIWKVVSNDPSNLEGMREFYGKIIPRWFAKYGKKLGVEVEPVRFPGMEDEAYRMEWVGPELTDEVMRDMADRADGWHRANIIHVMQGTNNPQQRAHALTSLMETGSPVFRTEVEYVLGSNPTRRVRDEGAGGTNLSIRVTPALRETVQRQGQALYSFPGPIVDALKTQAGQAAAGAGLGLAMEPDHPLYGALVGSAGALGVRVGYLRTSGKRMRNAIRRGTARAALSQFTDGQLEQLAKRYERLAPDVAAAMRGEVGERAARRTLTPQQIADRDVELLAEGPLRPVRQRVSRTLTAPEQSAITDAYRAGNAHLRRRIIDELEAAADEAPPAVERVYSRLIGGMELEGFDPLPKRANPVLDAGRHANLASFGLDPTGEKRLADHVRRIVEAEGLDPKRRVTWAETKQVARELGMQPEDVSALAKSSSGLTAAEMLAIRNQVRENVEGIERSSLRLAQMDGLETAEASLERQLLRQGIEQAEAQNTLLLSRFIRERSSAGRNLNALKILANQTMDPVVWRERAASALKARGLEFQEAVHGARIREIIESCG